MAKRDDGAIPMPPMSFAEQAEYFGAFVGGYSAASGKNLWALISADTLFVDNRDEGTRSHPLYRAALLDGPTLNLALRALMDSLPTWAKAAPLGDIPPDAEWFREERP